MRTYLRLAELFLFVFFNSSATALGNIVQIVDFQGLPQETH